MLNMSRRGLLAGVALLGAASLGGCVTNPSTGQPQLSPSVIDFVTNAVATVAKYIPAAESIAATAAALFGPGYASIVQIGSAAINTLIQALQSVVTNLTPKQSARLRSKLRAAAPNVLVDIGTITVTGPNGPIRITITGTRVA